MMMNLMVIKVMEALIIQTHLIYKQWMKRIFMKKNANILIDHSEIFMLDMQMV